jgi:predicted RNase H-like nuclease
MLSKSPPPKTKLLVGFDSAWTPNNSGALVGVLHCDDDSFTELGAPQVANFEEAEGIITGWQAHYEPSETIILLDQPTIVNNTTGQRPVENIVASPVSLRYGGVQPANTAREDMFGDGAPVWGFLSKFGGSANPLEPSFGSSVFETYPVLSIISLGWTLPDSRATGRLPKYNPGRKKTFSISDWSHVCDRVASEILSRGLNDLGKAVQEIGQCTSPKKQDQDCLDACICLLVALYLVEGRECLMIGNTHSGYITVPYGESLYEELSIRCEKTGRTRSEWVRSYQLNV